MKLAETVPEPHKAVMYLRVRRILASWVSFIHSGHCLFDVALVGGCGIRLDHTLSFSDVGTNETIGPIQAL